MCSRFHLQRNQLFVGAFASESVVKSDSCNALHTQSAYYFSHGCVRLAKEPLRSDRSLHSATGSASSSGETWDPGEFAALQRAIRDKALEVGLSYPWYVIPRPDEEESELEGDGSTR